MVQELLKYWKEKCGYAQRPFGSHQRVGTGPLSRSGAGLTAATGTVLVGLEDAAAPEGLPLVVLQRRHGGREVEGIPGGPRGWTRKNIEGKCEK